MSLRPRPGQPGLHLLRGHGEKPSGIALHPGRGPVPGHLRPFGIPPEIHPVLKNDGVDSHRAELYIEIWRRFGQEAADHLVTRLGFATRDQVIAWYRRAGYMATYPGLLEPEPLAVDFISTARLLKHAFGPPVRPAAVLIRFHRGRDSATDRSSLLQHAPWLLDLPNPDQAIAKLRLHSWLLFTVEPPGQADLLEQATNQTKWLSVAALVPERLAGATELQVRDWYLRGLYLDAFDKCLE